MSDRPLERTFFERDTLTVARELVGKRLVRVTDDGVTSGLIVETEAYLGFRDDAAHTYKGRTERTRVAFGDKGFSYVYLIYGMYCCFNVTAGAPGEPDLILLRALQPLDGIERMRARRPKAGSDRDLCRGPGRLCMALDIGRELYGIDLCLPGPLFLADGQSPPAVGCSPRIGIDYAQQCRDMPWRFFWKDSPYVSGR